MNLNQKPYTKCAVAAANRRLATTLIGLQLPSTCIRQSNLLQPSIETRVQSVETRTYAKNLIQYAVAPHHWPW
jgi:hypothetical protein